MKRGAQVHMHSIRNGTRKKSDIQEVRFFDASPHNSEVTRDLGTVI
jgi:hypothetical protein